MGRRGPKRAGEKRAGEYSSTGATLSARITIDTRRRLDAAAAANRQTLSGELEDRLIRSFALDDPLITERFGSWQTHAVLLLVAELTKHVHELTGQNWLNDRFTYDLVAEAVRLMFEALSPHGDGAPPDTFPKFIEKRDAKGDPAAIFFDPSTPLGAELGAKFRADVMRSIVVNRERFLLNMAHPFIAAAIGRVKAAPRTPDKANALYRSIEAAIRPYLNRSKT